MNSLEWRVKKLENKIIGQIGGLSADTVSIYDRLIAVAQKYEASDCKSYPRFSELYEKFLDQPSDQSLQSKAELVLLYYEDLVKYMDDLQRMAALADRVLNVDNWPDLANQQEKLKKLRTISKEQHLKSIKLDRQTEDLLDIYNQLIGSFKSNVVIWHDKLEAYEREDKKLDEPE